MDAPLRFERRLTESESGVLPLDDGAMVHDDGIEPPTLWV